MKNNAKTVKAVYESGNEIGSHTYAHANLTRQTEAEQKISSFCRYTYYKYKFRNILFMVRLFNKRIKRHKFAQHAENV